jgi:hypothetical protein
LDMIDESLRMTRIAAWAINHLLNHYQLGNLAEKFNGDDDSWSVDVPISVSATRHERMVAKVEFEMGDLTIYIPDIYQVIRSGHIKDFDPRDYGIVVKTIENFTTGDVEDDITAQLTVDEAMIPLLDGPRRMVPKSQHRRKFQVIGALSR